MAMPAAGIRLPSGSHASKIRGGVEIIPHPSPNFGERRGREAPDLVVLHYTAMKTAEAALERLCAPDFEVSSHYLIAEDGRVFQLVDDAHRAWHAGSSAWGATTDVNSASIGVELANPGNAPFPARLMESLETLLAEILDRYGIPPERVIGHSDCAPVRKCDPGSRFDWRRFAGNGLGIWPEMARSEGTFDSFVQDLKAFGYTFPAEPDALLNAFRLRFRPGVIGPFDDVDAGLAADLAARWPVDRPPAAT